MPTIRRHSGTAAKRDDGTTIRRHSGTAAKRDDGTTIRRHSGTTIRSPLFNTADCQFVNKSLHLCTSRSRSSAISIGHILS